VAWGVALGVLYNPFQLLPNIIPFMLSCMPPPLRRTLATVPLLTRVLSPSSCTVLVGRRLVPGKWQQLDALMAAVQQQQQVPLLVLFP